MTTDGPVIETVRFLIYIFEKSGWGVVHVYELMQFFALMFVSFLLWNALFNRLSPPLVNLYGNPNRSKAVMVEMPHRIYRLVHVLINAIGFVGITSGILGEKSMYLFRIIDTAYFLSDGWIVSKLFFKFNQAPTIWKKIQSCCNGEEDEDIKIQNPMHNWFHHVLTIISFFGAGQDNRTYVLFTYMCGEVALVAFNLTWFCCKVEWIRKLIPPKKRHQLQIFSCIIYGLFRVFGFAILGVFYIIPGLNWKDPFAWVMITIFTLLWGMNVTWWYSLLDLTFKIEKIKSQMSQFVQRTLLAFTHYSSMKSNTRNRNKNYTNDDNNNCNTSKQDRITTKSNRFTNDSMV